MYYSHNYALHYVNFILIATIIAILDIRYTSGDLPMNEATHMYIVVALSYWSSNPDYNLGIMMLAVIQQTANVCHTHSLT